MEYGKYWILHKEYYEMREKNAKRFEARLLELALHERKRKRDTLSH